MVNATPRPLYPRERDPVPTVEEAGWATGPDWAGAENLAPVGILSSNLPLVLCDPPVWYRCSCIQSAVGFSVLLLSLTLICETHELSIFGV